MQFKGRGLSFLFSPVNEHQEKSLSASRELTYHSEVSQLISNLLDVFLQNMVIAIVSEHWTFEEEKLVKKKLERKFTLIIYEAYSLWIYIGLIHATTTAERIYKCMYNNLMMFPVISFPSCRKGLKNISSYNYWRRNTGMKSHPINFTNCLNKNCTREWEILSGLKIHTLTGMKRLGLSPVT